MVWIGRIIARIEAPFSLLPGPDTSLYCRKQSVYVLTDQRAFILRNCNTEGPVRSLPLRFVDVVRAEEIRPDGRGSVQFLSWDRAARRWTYPMRFSKVKDADGVAERAIAARDAARR